MGTRHSIQMISISVHESGYLLTFFNRNIIFTFISYAKVDKFIYFCNHKCDFNCKRDSFYIRCQEKGQALEARLA